MEEWNGIQLLLAEDSDTDAELTLRAIRKSGIVKRSLRVKDGLEAIAFLYREGKYVGRDQALPEFILLDVQMPRCGGIEVWRRLHERVSTRNIPAVLLTATAQDPEFLETQTFEFMVKPVTPELLKLWATRTAKKP